jgi:hypothetical protein
MRCLAWTYTAPHNDQNPTSLDDLATMITQGFTQTQHSLDKRLGGTDQRLDKMGSVLNDVVQELTATHEGCAACGAAQTY